jgi:hypothetical protein
MLGSDYATNTWPGCEIDIMEYKGNEPNVIHGTSLSRAFGGNADGNKFTITNAEFQCI